MLDKICRAQLTYASFATVREKESARDITIYDERFSCFWVTNLTTCGLNVVKTALGIVKI